MHDNTHREDGVRVGVGGRVRPSHIRTRSYTGGGPVPSKWHWLYGEHLEALGRDAEADLKFADAYAATSQVIRFTVYVRTSACTCCFC